MSVDSIVMHGIVTTSAGAEGAGARELGLGVSGERGSEQSEREREKKEMHSVSTYGIY